MCSTPYGIRGLAPRLNTESSANLLVLNALRHQRFGTNIGIGEPLRQPVLNALRHQRFGTLWPPYAQERGVVLNALRHQRFGTLDRFQSMTFIICAQRLTASEVWHSKILG